MTWQHCDRRGLVVAWAAANQKTHETLSLFLSPITRPWKIHSRFFKKRKRNSTAHLLSEEKRNPFPRIRNGNDFSFSCNYIIKNAWKFPPSIRSQHIHRKILEGRNEGRRGSMNRISIGRERSTRQHVVRRKGRRTLNFIAADHANPDELLRASRLESVYSPTLPHHGREGTALSLSLSLKWNAF